ncbi:MAG: aa3-type cytochrome c oxidase subunit IV [Salinarimonas sp.]
MVQSERHPNEGYSPEMDGQTHEKTYDGFIVFTAISSAVVLCWVMALALGGIKDAWLSGILGVVASMIAGGVGAIFPSVGWRAPGAVFVLMVLVFILS